ncbi:MAG: UDP-N-acetylglucosamine 1-carboxyvinyltransferase, partial [Leptolyngbya sp. SIO1D8]|nr:UDP-N-acetylglucosamine 1-carboxyvinyltransferase [Leptolyngbya sp. SIO1D8]
MTALFPPSRLTSTDSEETRVLEIFGGHPLQGQVRISGAKNAALAVMAGTLLCSEDCLIRNVPHLADVNSMADILRALGVKVKHEGDVLDMNVRHISESAAPYDLVRQLRASFFLLGPLLARLGVAQMPLPGGCAIGTRPVDLHVQGLQKMGAHIAIKHGV